MSCCTAFNSFTYAALIIANVSFAIIGGIIGLVISSQYVSVPSAIGFIAVFGVAMLNGIVLVSFINELRDRGRSIREAVTESAALRLRPVLMTASVAILGLIPMLLSSGVAANGRWPPWSWAVYLRRLRSRYCYCHSCTSWWNAADSAGNQWCLLM